MSRRIVQMHPLISLSVDVLCLSLLFYWRPHLLDHQPWRQHDLALIRTCGLVALGAVLLTAGFRSVGDGIQPTGQAETESAFLKPETWIGQELTLARFIYDGQLLMQGHWLILIYRDSCSKCHELLEQLQRREFEPPADLQIALVKVPPSNPKLACRPFGNWLWTSLDPQQDWLIETPCVLNIDQGVVKSCTQSW